MQDYLCDVIQDAERTNQMVFVPDGTFQMGSDKPIVPQDGEGPARDVALDSFYIDVHEVSNSEFARFIEDTKYVTEVLYP